MEGARQVSQAQGWRRRPIPCPRCEALNPRAATMCPACGLSLEHQTLADRFTQAPWQLAVLSLLTFSLYDIYWFNRTWRMIRDLGQPKSAPRPLLLTIGLFIPILNVFLIYKLFETVRALEAQAAQLTPDDARASTGKEQPEAATLLILYVGLILCWLLPTPWWLAARLACWPLVIVQSQVNRYVAATLPDVRGARQMAWLELGALCVGLFFSVLLLNSTFGVS